jgi:hypothetical protein
MVAISDGGLNARRSPSRRLWYVCLVGVANLTASRTLKLLWLLMMAAVPDPGCPGGARNVLDGRTDTRAQPLTG